MNTNDIVLTQKALKLINEVEEDSKKDGLELLEQIIHRGSKQFVELGYKEVIFKELIKLVQFECDYVLEAALKLLEEYYFNENSHWDEICEVLIFRVVRSTRFDVSKVCLEQLSGLVDKFDDSIAKHSKQLLKLADLNDMVSLNPLICDILEKLKTKVPERKKSSS